IHIKRREAPVDMEKRKGGCTKLPPIRPNHSAQKANNVQALDVGVHSPETRAAHILLHLFYLQSMVAIHYHFREKKAESPWLPGPAKNSRGPKVAVAVQITALPAAIEELRPRCQEKKKQWDCEYQAFIMMMQEVLLAALARRLGKRAALVEVKRLLAAEQKTENKLTAAKIRNLALQMRVQSREEAIGELEERTKAEKLKFENENYKTMILEYEEELIRIKKGITSTREFQSHLKETINFVELEIQAKLANLAKIKAMIGNKRKALAGVMITKDKLRADNLRLYQRCSLLRNKKLLQDFEKVKDACEDLQSQIDILKRQHEKLSVKCSTVKSKLKQSRPLQHCV
ncbi:hypothetical protein P4O66_005333, partial [Electrophorus voltai]